MALSSSRPGLRSIGSMLAVLTRAATKFATGRIRRAGLLRVQEDWVQRATICERCPMRVIRHGISYCGMPFLEDVVREEHIDGCGCPTREKAKSPKEHCPITLSNDAARSTRAGCDCKWCLNAVPTADIVTSPRPRSSVG